MNGMSSSGYGFFSVDAIEGEFQSIGQICLGWILNDWRDKAAENN